MVSTFVRVDVAAFAVRASATRASSTVIGEHHSSSSSMMKMMKTMMKMRMRNRHHRHHHRYDVDVHDVDAAVVDGDDDANPIHDHHPFLKKINCFVSNV